MIKELEEKWKKAMAVILFPFFIWLAIGESLSNLQGLFGQIFDIWIVQAAKDVLCIRS